MLQHYSSEAVEFRDTSGGREIVGTAAVFYDGSPRTEFVLDAGGNGRRRVR